jgi:cytochrome c-type biogenesis protein CcmF
LADLGAYAQLLALVAAAIGLGAALAAGVARRSDWCQVAERAVWVTTGFVTVAMLGLFWALATFDFRLGYVAAHSARSMTLTYRLAALWGGQAGSLLLWLWILLAYASAAVAIHRRGSAHLMPWVCGTLLANALFFLVLVNFLTNPFEKLPPGEVLSDGTGLNPLLQHPVMMIHPLMLYTGLTGFAVPFAFALAALVTGELGSAWLRATRRWVLVPWFFLSIGILLGGRWAYEVLGWGGYWAWDPVENASFMPWLAATAYLHSVMIQEKRDMLRTWNMVLVGLTYTLCLFGTFLTRSGLVQSVHAFAQTEWFGRIFLGYVLATAALFLVALLARRERLRSANRLESALSREAGFLLNNWVLVVILVIVFWGTLFPKISQWWTEREISVGPAWFNAVAGPFALFLLFLTGVGPLVAWRRASWPSLRRQFTIPAATGIVTALALLAGFRGDIPWYPLAAWSLGAFVVASIVQDYARAMRSRMRSRRESPLRALAALLRKNQQRYGGYVVHLGVVCILFGAAGAAFNRERLETVRPGERVAIDGYALEYLTAEPLPKQHYGGAVARLALYQGDRPLKVMTPERRVYWLEQQPASIPSIHSTLGEDLYVVLTAIEADGAATLKLHRNPLVNWIWVGGWTLVLGTVLILWPHPRPAERSRE